MKNYQESVATGMACPLMRKTNVARVRSCQKEIFAWRRISLGGSNATMIRFSGLRYLARDKYGRREAGNRRDCRKVKLKGKILWIYALTCAIALSGN
jgi:hypothetical protein